MSDVREFEIRQLAISSEINPMMIHQVLQYRYKTPGQQYFDPTARTSPDSYTEWKDVPVVYTSLDKVVL